MFIKFNILWVKLLIRLKNEMVKKMHQSPAKP
jgi:hypothetical protein